jgi:hypothetical protein
MAFGFPVPAGAGGVKIHVPEFAVELGRSCRSMNGQTNKMNFIGKAMP